MSHYNKHIFVCSNLKESGKSCGLVKIDAVDLLKKKIELLPDETKAKVRVSISGCLGKCSLGPNVVIYPEGVWCKYTKEEDLTDIVNKYIS